MHNNVVYMFSRKDSICKQQPVKVVIEINGDIYIASSTFLHKHIM
jgi:CMP-N-acetylneuraminic acid synthetase